MKLFVLFFLEFMSEKGKVGHFWQPQFACIWPWQMLCPLMIPNQLACVSASASGVHLGGLDL